MTQQSVSIEIEIVKEVREFVSNGGIVHRIHMDHGLVPYKIQELRMMGMGIKLQSIKPNFSHVCTTTSNHIFESMFFGNVESLDAEYQSTIKQIRVMKDLGKTIEEINEWFDKTMPNEISWEETWKGKRWVGDCRTQQFIIDLQWTFIGKKTKMFMVYVNNKDFQSGNNTITKNTLAEAKKFCEDYLKGSQNVG